MFIATCLLSLNRKRGTPHELDARRRTSAHQWNTAAPIPTRRRGFSVSWCSG